MRLEAPDYLEPIEGWRVWLVVPDGDHSTPRLRSVVQKTVWPARNALVAECCQRRVLAKLLRRPVHESVPELTCQCGIYATELTRLEPLLAEAPWETGARVLGRVRLWGEVLECEQGWRASHAYPAHLYVPVREGRRPRLTQEEIAAGLADYGVPVELLPCRPSQAVGALTRGMVRRRRRSNAA